MSIQSAADYNIGYVVIVCSSLIAYADMRAVTIKDWLLLIVDLRFVVIHRIEIMSAYS